MEKNMKFKRFLKKILTEDTRLDVLIDKYTKPKKDNELKRDAKALMGIDVLAEIIFADPTTKMPEGTDKTDYSIENLKQVQPGQYVNWMLKNFVKPDSDREISLERHRELFMEDLFKLTEDLAKFTKYKQYFPVDKRDINKFTPTSLFTFLNNFELPEKVKEKLKKSEVKKEIRKEREGFSHPGSTIELVGDNYTVIKISDTGEKGKEAASWYGGYYDHQNGESRWCTSPPDSRWFNTYIKDGPLYVILANNDSNVGKRTGLPQERYQFHFPSNQFMDRLDHEIDLIDFLKNKAPDLKEYFKNNFLPKVGNQVEVKYLNNSEGKYIALYGLEDFFDNLPDDIVELSFRNTTSETVSFDIPKTISKFYNLSMLLLDNTVKSLPNEVGDLKNLYMLILTNNKNLNKLPSTIGKMEKLTVLNLMGSGKNLFRTLPSNVQEMFHVDDLLSDFYIRK